MYKIISLNNNEISTKYSNLRVNLAFLTVYPDIKTPKEIDPNQVRMLANKYSNFVSPRRQTRSKPKKIFTFDVRKKY